RKINPQLLGENTLVFSEVLIYFNCSSDSTGQVTVIQTPTEKHVQNGQTVTLTCKTSSSIGRQSDGWCNSCFSWYLQKPGEPPKLLVHSIKTLHTGTPSRFSGSGSNIYCEKIKVLLESGAEQSSVVIDIHGIQSSLLK
uniref:Immunoglobulin V-set domain-containing protein n=1 Tax=Sinocyclocheilus rhinocerous TaxID=307959 RepID=A0A673N5S1_9TELE